MNPCSPLPPRQPSVHPPSPACHRQPASSPTIHPPYVAHLPPPAAPPYPPPPVRMPAYNAFLPPVCPALPVPNSPPPFVPPHLVQRPLIRMEHANLHDLLRRLQPKRNLLAAKAKSGGGGRGQQVCQARGWGRYEAGTRCSDDGASLLRRQRMPLQVHLTPKTQALMGITCWQSQAAD